MKETLWSPDRDEIARAIRLLATVEGYRLLEPIQFDGDQGTSVLPIRVEVIPEDDPAYQDGD